MSLKEKEDKSYPRVWVIGRRLKVIELRSSSGGLSRRRKIKGSFKVLSMRLVHIVGKKETLSTVKKLKNR